MLLLFLLLASALSMAAGCSAQGGAGAAGAAGSDEGYRAVAVGSGCFIGVGTGGRVDKLNYDNSSETCESPTSATLNAVTNANGKYLAVGDGGAVVVSPIDDVKFTEARSGTRKDLLASAGFNGYFFAAGRDGTLLRSGDGSRWEKIDLGVENDIVTMAANAKTLFALTREGQIISTANGETFSVQDYNKEFEGYNESMYWFHKISSLGETFFITGSLQEYEDAPMIMMSDTGEVWMPRSIAEINDEPPEGFLPLIFGDAGIGGNNVVIAANGGRLFSLSDCSSCNVIRDVADVEINALAYTVSHVMLAGGDFWFEAFETDDLRLEE
jgi:photosystem II stability/assembly factor-like uncharacterized protein